MGCKPTGGKAGRKSDLEADQIEFLESYGERFRAGSGTSALYSEVLEKWIERFGYAGLNPKNKNAIDLAELWLDDDLALVSVEERKKIVNLREEAKLAIRTKLGNWFCHHYHSHKENKDGVDEVLRSLLEISQSRPHKKSELAVYSETYYDSKLKAGFDEMWNGCLQGGVPPKKRISLIKSFTQESWLNETDAVKDDIRRKCEADHEEALEAWKGRTEWSGTPEKYQIALANLDAVLPPFADAISKYTGMVAVVTVLGPSGENGGELVVRSTQSVTSKDKARQTWAQADMAGYQAFQNSLFSYGRAYFSDSECLSRVVNNEVDLPTTSESASSVEMHPMTAGIPGLVDVNATVGHAPNSQFASSAANSTALLPNANANSQIGSLATTLTAPNFHLPGNAPHSQAEVGISNDALPALLPAGTYPRWEANDWSASDWEHWPSSLEPELLLPAQSLYNPPLTLPNSAMSVAWAPVPHPSPSFDSVAHQNNSNWDGSIPHHYHNPYFQEGFTGASQPDNVARPARTGGGMISAPGVVSTHPAQPPTLPPVDSDMTVEGNIPAAALPAQLPTLPPVEGGIPAVVSGQLSMHENIGNGPSGNSTDRALLSAGNMASASVSVTNHSTNNALPGTSSAPPTSREISPPKANGRRGKVLAADRKRKTDVIDENANAGIEDQRSRRKLVVPAHLERGGYKPPKKGMRKKAV